MLPGLGKRSLLFGLLLIVSVFFMASTGVASSGSDIETLRAELERLEENDQRNVAGDDIAQARQWLDEAQEQIARRETRGAEFRVRRVQHTVDLIRALIQVGNIDGSVEQQQERYAEAQAEIERLQNEIVELEGQKSDRERELRRVREGR